jgi:antagonist of KipI
LEKVSATILRAGPLTAVQDLGRDGFRGIGVGTSGALDRFAARVANLLTGNDEAAALIEVTLGMFRIRFNDARVLAWCGGAFEARIAGEQISAGRAFAVATGEELAIDRPNPGCRAWLAISGGIDLPLTLGSRSTDLRANFGGLDGRSLRANDELPFGTLPARAQAFSRALGSSRIGHWSAPAHWAITADSHPVLRVIRGPHWDRFEESAQKAFFSENFSVTAEADRMGVRLDGPELNRLKAGDLISEAVTPGTVQIPPNGKPILLLGDCQTIGGYPKIAHVITADLPIAAQLRPGDQLRFSEVSLAVAHELLLTRESELERFRIGLEFHAA